VPESVERWWSRRQWSTGRTTPYAIGHYRDAWSPYTALVEQFRPERNHDLLLSQIPPAAEVWLVWVCSIGHEFVATPAEQRARPGRVRASRSWCPVCAQPRLVPSGPKWPRPALTDRAENRSRPGRAPRHVPRRSEALRIEPAHAVPPGRAFRSELASRATSASEAAVRESLTRRLAVELGCNAVRVRRPFFDRYEVWPDIVIPELAVAIELDTVGRNADEHVGRREAIDRRKDRLLREVGWEVVRLRVRPLRALGPFDLVVPGVSQRAIDALVDRVSDARGPLIVRAYQRESDEQRPEQRREGQHEDRGGDVLHDQHSRPQRHDPAGDGAR
jgi:very-short-patch-repair endonuclease